MTTVILAIVAGLALAALAWLGWKHLALRRRFAPVVDIDAELRRVTNAVRRLQADQERMEDDARRRQEKLASKYASAKSLYERLQRELALLEENLEDISFGLYKPHFDFATPAEYKAKLDEVYEQQKRLIRSERTIRVAVEWTIEGNKKKGARMQKQYGKLLLRAFNGECDAATAKVTWNNVTRMEERIGKAFAAINELGGVMQISLMPEYRDLRLRELNLYYEMEEKERQVAEEQRCIREQMREEERVQRELERAQKKAEDEEARYEKALAKARAEMAEAKGAELDRLNATVQELTEQIAEAHATRERAVSQAQLTRSGHVYIISNVGSFGDNIFKIGMTRRLEPEERIKELSDASVPFEFDIHGMIQSKDAPSLEAEIHRCFEQRRVNLINRRKEFFRVSLQELDEFVRTKKLQVELTKLAEAREYRETLALRQKAAAQGGQQEEAKSAFPEQLFA